MEFKKKIAFSNQNQLTIPKIVVERLGIEKQVMLEVVGQNIILTPVKKKKVDEILSDLLKQGFSGDELSKRFKEAISEN